MSFHITGITKVFSPWYEGKCWIRAGWRKQWYRYKERHIMEQLQTELDQRYFLAILQVYNDSQIHHSPYKDVRNYINDVMFSFPKRQRRQTFLCSNTIQWILDIAYTLD